MKLDTKQSYGQVSGYHYGAVFEQHGRLFDADGEEIIVPAEGESVEKTESTTIAAPKASKPKTAPAKAATKGPKKKVVFPVNPPIPALAVAAKASAVDDQLAAQSQ